jgi:hypothetical protein
MVYIAFSGCAKHTEVVYVEAQCPQINVPERIPVIEVNVSDGCICGDSLQSVFDGINHLRNTESYCIDQLIKYNKEFADEIIR